MSNLITAIIRTIVPVIVGYLTTWLISLGINLDQTIWDGFSNQLVLIVSGVYYAAVAWAETHWPWVGWLLGLARRPAYGVGVDSGIPDQK